MRFLLICGILSLCLSCGRRSASQIEEIGAMPVISPDYANIVVPANIAPLNFHIDENGNDFLIEYFHNEKVILQKRSKDKAAIFSEKEWHRVLSAHRGDTLYVRISNVDGNQPRQYKQFYQIISEDSIDEYLSYRPINPVGGHFHSLEIIQRQLGSFNTYTLFQNSLADGACINCHTYSSNDPDVMMFHVRNKHAGTILVQQDRVVKVNLALPDGRNGIFPAWHPNGTILAFSTNQMYAHQEKGVLRTQMYSFDTEADIFLYDLETNTIFSDSSLMDRSSQRTYPTWSRDGRFLYYCQTANVDCDFSAPDSNCIREIRYELFRIAFDKTSRLFGKPELVISSADVAGESVSFPVFSPDGKFLLFCTTKFGTLDPGQTDSDLWIYETESEKIRKMDELNSEYVESYHSWSSNSKWFVFSSRRIDGLFARPFFSRLNDRGEASKPFVLPQKDPLFFARYPYALNIPELSVSKVKVSPYDFSAIVHGEALQPEFCLPGNYQSTVSPHQSEIY